MSPEVKIDADAQQMQYQADAVGALLYDIYKSRTVKGANDQTYDIYPAAVTPDRGAYLANIVREVRPAATLEIGLAWGLSTLFILRTLLENGRAASHLAMDPVQRYAYQDAALHVLRDNGLERMVEFYPEASVYLLPRLAEQGRRFDFGFIDGDHSYEAVFCDFWLLDPLIRPGGVIVFDDVWSEGVDRVCCLAHDEFGYEMHSEHLDPGFIYRPLMRTYVKTDRPDFRQPSQIERLSRQFTAARAAAILGLEETLRSSYRTAAQIFAHAGLAALARGDRRLARLHFYRSLHYRPLRLKTYARLTRTFLPLGLARILSGRTLLGASQGTGLKP